MKISRLIVKQGDFTLDIRDVGFDCGLVHVISGDNGVGKSTLLKGIADLIKAEVKDIDYQGLAFKDMTMLFQKPYILNRSVRDNLVYPLRLRGLVDEVLVDTYLNDFALMAKRDQNALSLSFGEKQRLAFARALIFSPKLVLMDEPFANLDLSTYQLISQKIQAIQKNQAITWLCVSHDVRQIEELGDRVWLLAQGKLKSSEKYSKIVTDKSLGKTLSKLDKEEQS